jgi:hypothetical protein
MRRKHYGRSWILCEVFLLITSLSLVFLCFVLVVNIYWIYRDNSVTGTAERPKFAQTLDGLQELCQPTVYFCPNLR